MRIVPSRKSISAMFDPLGKEKAVIPGIGLWNTVKLSPLYRWSSSSKKERSHE